MSTFELDPARDQAEPAVLLEPMGLSSTVLLENARWFLKMRWIMTGLCVLLGLACSFCPGSLRQLKLVPPVSWPWTLACVLGVINTIFHYLVQRLREDSRRAIETNLWLQVVADLLIVTAVVHLVGSTSTLIAFAYLFHIALSCVFFPKRDSLLVTLLAAGLYIACITFEVVGILPVSGVLAAVLHPSQRDPYLRLLFAGSAVAVWLVIWYLVSTLSEAVRKRDQRLDAANQRIIRADQEQNRQVLRTTHDLKAPFAGIESSIDVLRSQYWKEIPGSVRRIVERIERRAERLRKRIDDILLLGDLRSQTEHEESCEGVVLRSVLNDVVWQLGRKAEDRGVTVQIQGVPAVVFSSGKQLTILLSNLVSNAISYSPEGGSVTVAVAQSDDDVSVSVSDNGIGIRADALPHMFDDYFRTREAAEFNKMSTGLGLAIVKEIARRFGMKIKVTSEEGVGTTFEVTIPKKRTTGAKQRRTAGRG